MTQQAFDNLAAIDTHFNQLLAEAADDSAKMQIRLDRSSARESLLERQNQELQLREVRTTVLRDFPDVRPDDIRGGNEAEIRASAKAAQEHIDGVLTRRAEQQQADLEQRGRQRYGSGNTTGSGNEPPATGQDPVQEVIAEHEVAFGAMVSGAPFDLKEVHGKTMAAALGAISQRTVDKNVQLLDRGKAGGPGGGGNA